MKKTNFQSGLASIIVIIVGVLLIAAIVGGGYWYAKKYFANALISDSSAEFSPIPKGDKEESNDDAVLGTSTTAEVELTATSSLVQATSTVSATSTASTTVKSAPATTTPSGSATLKTLLSISTNQSCKVDNVINGKLVGSPGAGTVYTKGGDIMIMYKTSDSPTNRILVKGDTAYVSTEKKDNWVGVKMKANQLNAYLAGKVDLPGFIGMDTPIAYECKSRIFTDDEYEGLFMVPTYVVYTDL
ncbi:MAG: hypothetical protein V4576_01240 [Patescibacteria group bacterium]